MSTPQASPEAVSHTQSYPQRYSYPNWHIGDRVSVQLDVEDAISMREALSVMLEHALQSTDGAHLLTHKAHPLYYAYVLLGELESAPLTHRF